MKAIADPTDQILAAIENHGLKVDRRKGRAQCPAHRGKDLNLHVWRREDGSAGVYCHSHACEYREIMEAIGLTAADGFAEPPQDRNNRLIAFTADYRDADGELKYQSVRYHPKGFNQRRPDGEGGWIWNLSGIDPLPFQLPELLESTGLVLIVEGEKDVFTAEALGFVATCNSGGAGKWKDAQSVYLAGRDVAVIADNDGPGIDHAQSVAKSVQGIAHSVRVLDPLPGVPEKGDLSDWVRAGGTADQLCALIDAAPLWEPSRVQDLRIEPPKIETPVLHPAARYGLAGDVVAAFEPHTEADPAAILSSFLVAFGNACGPSPKTWVGETRHGVNLYVVNVGKTSRSRKGTSWGPVARIFEATDNAWLSERKAGGIGSGEALVWAIRDPSEPKEKPKNGETIIEDQGVEDKRLMVHEGEFASILKVANREGSILSEIVRKAWDSDSPLRNMVKRSPVQATSPHISIVGHITLPELKRELSDTSQANGFANRFLWVFVQRSKLLPNPPRLDSVTVGDLAARIRKALFVARQGGTIKRDEQADELWKQVYADLSKESEGMFDALTARAEAQVIRLSMVYALLDCSIVVRVEHLVAALAFWKYCEDSVRFIFGDATGDPVADRIREALLTGPLSETEIRDLFARHQKTERIQHALQCLKTAGLVTMEPSETGGRPARIWRAV
jgi:hypothetical protein